MARGILNTYAWPHQITLAPQTTLKEIPKFDFAFSYAEGRYLSLETVCFYKIHLL